MTVNSTAKLFTLYAICIYISPPLAFYVWLYWWQIFNTAIWKCIIIMLQWLCFYVLTDGNRVRVSTKQGSSFSRGNAKMKNMIRQIRVTSIWVRRLPFERIFHLVYVRFFFLSNEHNVGNEHVYLIDINIEWSLFSVYISVRVMFVVFNRCTLWSCRIVNSMIVILLYVWWVYEFWNNVRFVWLNCTKILSVNILSRKRNYRFVIFFYLFEYFKMSVWWWGLERRIYLYAIILYTHRQSEEKVEDVHYRKISRSFGHHMPLRHQSSSCLTAGISNCTYSSHPFLYAYTIWCNMSWAMPKSTY